MKTKALLIGTAFALSVSGISLSILVHQEVKEASAFPKTNPQDIKRIDLNPTESQTIRNYYSNATGLRGDNLLISLKNILKNGQNYFAYDSWYIYQIADRDWDKSPASAISSYNSTTNIIENYSYSSGDPYCRALYVNRNVDNQTKVKEDHTQTNWGINREHVWAKSHGFGADVTEQPGARGDPMHLIAGNGYVNNIHSNYFYGYVDTSSSYTDCGNYRSYLSNNLLGTSLTKGSGTVFEPQDSDKGDIARAVFYMAARYNNLAGDDSEIDINNPNLKLVDKSYDSNGNASYVSDSTVGSKTYGPGEMGVLSDLLEWNRLDPPDEYEIRRHDILYTNYTNNRNPFIDFPQWAEIIWGNQSGTANPATDAINNKAGVVLSSSELTINYGTNATISAVSSNKSDITWSISDSSVATLSKTSTTSGTNITITPKKKGTATITASATVEGSVKSAECALTIKAPLTSVSISDTPTTIVRNTTFAFSGTLTAQYSDGSSKVVSPTSVSNVDTSTLGNKTVTVSYTEEGVSKQTSYTIEVIKPVLDSIEIKTPKTLYGEGEVFVRPQVIAHYVNGDKEDVSTLVTYTGNDTSTQTTGREVTASYTEGGVTKTAKFTIVVEEARAILQNIEIVHGTTVFALNDEFIFDGYLIATYDKGEPAHVMPTDISTVDMSQVGKQTVTVSYTEGGITKSDTYEITVNNVVDHFVCEGQTTEFLYGQDFAFDGVAKLVYKNGDEEEVTPTSVSTPDMEVLGNQTVTVTYGVSSFAQAFEYEITVKNYIESLTITGQQTEFNYGDTFSFNGSVVANYADGTSKQVTPESVTSPDMTQLGTQHILITYKEDEDKVTEELEITINNVLTGITLSGQRTEFYVGDEFEFDGTITASYIDGSSRVITEGYITNSPNMSTAGPKTVIVSYFENDISKTARYTINVNEVIPTSISVSDDAKVEYDIGDDFVRPTITLTYNSGKTEVVTNSCKFTGQNMNKSGEQTVTVTYEYGDNKWLTTTYTITVKGIIPIGFGCNGNIATTSIILSALSLVGVGLLLAKKKKRI